MLTKGAGSFAAIINSGMSYLLRAFTSDTGAADQGYSDAQVLDTAAEGVLDGSLTATVVSGGTLGLSSGIAFGTGSQPMYKTTSIITRSVGIGLFLTQPYQYSVYFGFLNNYNTGYPAIKVVNQYSLNLINGSSNIFLLPALSTGINYNFAFVWGGYNVDGVPYKDGDNKSDFKYGSSLYWKYHNVSDWMLVWRERTTSNNSYAGYAGYSSFDYLSNLLIPDYDFSAVLQPILLDTFTDTDGTSLADHTPDVCPVGSSWSVVAGTDWDIQSNKLTCDGAANDMAVIDAGVADLFIECSVTPQLTDASNYSVVGVILRYSDSTHNWLVDTDPNGDTFRIYEIAGGSYTKRASASVTIAGNTAYNVKVKANGTTISAWLNNANAISYASASSNQTETKVGVRLGKTGTPPADSTWDNFAVWPLTSAVYDSEFSKSGYGY